MKAKDKDPTTTLTLRAKTVKASDRRFDNLKKAVRKLVVDQDAFGLNPVVNSPLGVQVQDYRRFAYLRDYQKIDAFNGWLDDQIQIEILQRSRTDPIERHWLSLPIQDAYSKGVRTTRRDISNAIQGEINQPQSVFANPVHVARAELLYVRAYDALEGVTRAMSTAMSRELANGMINGHGVDKIARAINRHVDGIGKVRARLIARTEIVNAHNVASIFEAQDLEAITGETLDMIWHTSLDGRERDSHRARHGKIYTRDEALALCGEPNCRCSVTAYVDVEKIINR